MTLIVFAQAAAIVALAGRLGYQRRQLLYLDDALWNVVTALHHVLKGTEPTDPGVAYELDEARFVVAVDQAAAVLFPDVPFDALAPAEQSAARLHGRRALVAAGRMTEAELEEAQRAEMEWIQ
jgi:hypothetical protein